MGIETVLLTRRSNALAMSAIAPLIATRTSGQRRRAWHESVSHFHTTRLCVSWAKPQESGRKLATWRGNLVFPPEKMSARVTNSGWKFWKSFRKPANTTEALYLAGFPDHALPPAGLFFCSASSASRRSLSWSVVRAWQDTDCDRHQHHREHAERTMCDRWKACSEARSWRDGEQLVGMISCR